MGGSASADLSVEEVAGKTAREFLKQVVGHPQSSETAARTARLIEQVLQTMKAIDAEVIPASGNRADGIPISLDDVLVEGEEGEGQDESVVARGTEEITIRLSEAYRGGDAPCPFRRHADGR
jgi:hypothetical protein